MQLQHQTFARGSAVTKVAAAAVNYATTCRIPSPEPRSSKRRSELWLKRAARQCSISARSQDGPASQQASQPTRQQLGRSSLGASAATLFGRVQCTQFGIHFRIFVIISFLFDFGFSASLLFFLTFHASGNYFFLLLVFIVFVFVGFFAFSLCVKVFEFWVYFWCVCFCCVIAAVVVCIVVGFIVISLLPSQLHITTTLLNVGFFVNLCFCVFLCSLERASV